jgi:hypothetical protein
MSLGEVALEILGLFLLMAPLAVLRTSSVKPWSQSQSQVLCFPWVKNADAIQEAIEYTRPEPVLLVAPWLFHHVDRMISFPLLVVALR